MKKYRINIKAQAFEFTNIENARQKVRELFGAGLWLLDLDQIEEEKEEIDPIDSEEGIEQRDRAREKMLKKAEKEEKLKNSVQRIKPIMIDPKIKKMAELPPGKRYRRTKAEMIADGEQVKEPSVRKPRTDHLFPEEINDFIKEKWEDNRDKDLVELIEKKFNKTYSVDQVKSHRKQIGCVSNKPGRKKGQKAIVSTESDRKPLKAKQNKYPDELRNFCIENIGEMRNQELLEAANEKFDLNLDYNRLASYLKYNNIKREKVKKKIDKQKVGKPKKYTDEVLQFLRDNINNFKNKELCEELESRFNIKVSPDTLGQTMNNKGIKRDRQEEEEVGQEIIDFIQKSKTKDAYILRDEIIEKFENNIPIRKIINFMAKKKEDLPGESVGEEVKRIKEKRDALDEDIDDLELD